MLAFFFFFFAKTLRVACKYACGTSIGIKETPSIRSAIEFVFDVFEVECTTRLTTPNTTPQWLIKFTTRLTFWAAIAIGATCAFSFLVLSGGDKAWEAAAVMEAVFCTDRHLKTSW